MQKVAKEFLGQISAGTAKLPEVPDAQSSRSWDLTVIDNVLKCLKLREVLLFTKVCVFLLLCVDELLTDGSSSFVVGENHETRVQQGQ